MGTRNNEMGTKIRNASERQAMRPGSMVRGPGSGVRDPWSGDRGPWSGVRGPGSRVRGQPNGNEK